MQQSEDENKNSNEKVCTTIHQCSGTTSSTRIQAIRGGSVTKETLKIIYIYTCVRVLALLFLCIAFFVPFFVVCRQVGVFWHARYFV